MENSPDWHGKSTNPEEYRQAMEELTKAGEELCRM
jgi:transketolase